MHGCVIQPFSLDSGKKYKIIIFLQYILKEHNRFGNQLMQYVRLEHLNAANRSALVFKVK